MREDNIKFPPEFISMDSTPVSVATIKRERMEEILREAVEADRKQRGEQDIGKAVEALKAAQNNLGESRPFGSSDPKSIYYDDDAFMWDYYQDAIDSLVAPQPVAQKGDMRFNDGKLWVCTDPNIGRWVCPDDTVWQLVPKNPTKEMLLAGKHTIKGADTTFEGILAGYAYLSMLEAAPRFGG